MKRVSIALAALCVVASSAQAQTKDILDTAASDVQFSTFVKAVKTAGLDSKLKGKGPFTVFAPTNAAFAKLSPALQTKLLSDKDALLKLLQYHITYGKFSYKNLTSLSVSSVAGPALMLRKSPAPTVNLSNVVKMDIPASNGVIQAVDAILLPGVGMPRKPFGKAGVMSPNIRH